MSSIASEPASGAAGALQVASIVGGEARADAPGGTLTSTNPANTSEVVAEVLLGDASTFVDAARAARAAQKEWAAVPAPARGRVIAQVGRLVEANKEALASLVTREIGKPYPEALGEVQEIVDTCDFFLGEGRRLYGQTVPSEMPEQAALHVPDAGRRRGDHHRGQLPGRGAGLVPGAGDPVRQRGRLEAGGVLAPRWATRWRKLFHAGGVPGGVLNVVQASGADTFAGLEAALEARAGRQGRLHRAPAPSARGSASCAGATCSRRAWSSAARTRWS